MPRPSPSRYTWCERANTIGDTVVNLLLLYSLSFRAEFRSDSKEEESKLSSLSLSLSPRSSYLSSFDLSSRRRFFRSCSIWDLRLLHASVHSCLMSGGGGGGMAERASSAARRALRSETSDASHAVRCFLSSAIRFSNDDIVCLSS